MSQIERTADPQCSISLDLNPLPPPKKLETGLCLTRTCLWSLEVSVVMRASEQVLFYFYEQLVRSFVILDGIEPESGLEAGLELGVGAMSLAN